MSKDIDDLFSDKMSNEIESELKKKRGKLNTKLIVKAIVATLGILIVLNIALGFSSKKYIAYRFKKCTSDKSIEYLVSHPNEYIAKQSYIETGLFKSTSTYNIAKKVGPRTLYAGSENVSSGLIRYGLVAQESWYTSEATQTLDNNIENRGSDAFGLRGLRFMMPYVDYENIINDFHYLNEIKENQYAEMALSFDKEYSYDEVNKMLDSNLITFYWVDINQEETKEIYKESKYYYSGDSVVGVKSHDFAGKFITDTNERLYNFKGAVGFLKEKDKHGVAYNINKNNIDENNIKISGVVIQGNPNELLKMQDNPMIKHAVLGNVVDKY